MKERGRQKEERYKRNRETKGKWRQKQKGDKRGGIKNMKTKI